MSLATEPSAQFDAGADSPIVVEIGADVEASAEVDVAIKRDVDSDSGVAVDAGVVINATAEASAVDAGVAIDGTVETSADVAVHVVLLETLATEAALASSMRALYVFGITS